ncbi:MAG: hypothetical protein ACRDJK_10790, partial [Actinomycetota bacterium]
MADLDPERAAESPQRLVLPGVGQNLQDSHGKHGPDRAGEARGSPVGWRLGRSPGADPRLARERLADGKALLAPQLLAREHLTGWAMRPASACKGVAVTVIGSRTTGSSSAPAACAAHETSAKPIIRNLSRMIFLQEVYAERACHGPSPGKSASIENRLKKLGLE